MTSYHDITLFYTFEIYYHEDPSLHGFDILLIYLAVRPYTKIIIHLAYGLTI